MSDEMDALLEDLFESDAADGEAAASSRSNANAGANGSDNAPSRANGGAKDGDEGKATATSGDDDDLGSADGKLNKRFKDTQKAFHDERQARLKLESDMTAMKAQLEEFSKRAAAGDATTKEQKAVTKIVEDLETAFEDDPLAAIKNALLAMEKKVDSNRGLSREDVELVSQQRAIEVAEAEFRKANTDYDSFVDAAFIDELRNSPQLNTAWRKNGGDPKAAYELAKRERAVKEYRDTGVMPAWATANSGNGSRTEPSPPKKTLAGVASASPGRGRPEPQSLDSVEDIMEDLWGQANKKR